MAKLMAAVRKPVPVVVDTTAPTIPGSFSTSLSGNFPVLTWTQSTDTQSGVVEYRIYRGVGAGTRTYYDRTTALTYTDTNVTPSTVYVYHVTAVDGKGNESSASSTDTETIPGGDTADVTAPPVPTTTEESVTQSLATVSWSPVDDTTVGGALTSGTKQYRPVVNGVQLTPIPHPTTTPPGTGRDIGSPTSAGSHTLNTGTYELTSYGQQLYGSQDEFYAFTRPQTGAAHFAARLVSITGGGEWSKGGLIARASDDPQSPYIAVVAFKSGFAGGALEFRASAGAQAQQVATFLFALPEYLALFRTTDSWQVRGSNTGSGDPDTWTLLATLSAAAVDMPPTVEFGMFCCSGYAPAAVATFDNTDWSGLASIVYTFPIDDDATFEVIAEDNAGNLSAASTTLNITYPGSPEAATKIFQPNGAGGAYTAFSTAVAACVSGDILELRTNSVGGTNTVNQPLAIVGRHFSPPLTIRVRSGDTITINNSSGTSHTYWSWTNLAQTGRIGIFIKDSSGIIIDGGVMGALKVGDRSDWSSGSPYNRSQARCLELENSSDIEIRYLYGTGGSDYVGNRVTRDCSNIRLKHLDFRYHYHNAPDTGIDGQGDMFRVDGDRILIEDFAGDHGGHDLFVGECYNSIIRDCDFDGYWGDISSTFYGTRCAIFASANNTGRVPQSSTKAGVAGPLLVEYNTLRRSGPNQRSGSQLWQPAMKLVGRDIIFRFNNLYDHAGQIAYLRDYAGFESSDLTSTFSDGGIRFYNNTIVACGGIAQYGSEAFMTHVSIGSDIRIFNNIISRLTTNPDVNQAQRFSISYYPNAFPNGSYSSLWRNCKFYGNIIELVPGIQNGRIYTYDAGVNVIISNANLNHAQGSGSLTWPNDVYSNAVYSTATMLWANGTTNPTRSEAGLVVSNWGALAAAGDAWQHANIAATSSGTTITVDDVNCFSDGYGITGELGDLIGIGANAAAAASNTVRIAAGGINRTTKQITLVSSKSVTNGQKVWVCDRNSALADNRGRAQ